MVQKPHSLRRWEHAWITSRRACLVLIKIPGICGWEKLKKSLSQRGWDQLREIGGGNELPPLFHSHTLSLFGVFGLHTSIWGPRSTVNREETLCSWTEPAARPTLGLGWREGSNQRMGFFQTSKGWFAFWFCFHLFCFSHTQQCSRPTSASAFRNFKLLLAVLRLYIWWPKDWTWMNSFARKSPFPLYDHSVPFFSKH